MENLFNIEKVENKLYFSGTMPIGTVITLKEITDILDVRHNDAMTSTKKLGEVPSFGVLRKLSITSSAIGGRPTATYALTKKQAIAVGAKLNNSLLMKVIDRLEELTEKPKMPNHLETAKMLVSSLEDNQKLKVENLALEDKIQDDKPKIVFANSVSQSYSSILIGQFAKAISKGGFTIGQNRLFTWLRENGFLCSSGANYNQPKQKYIDNKYFEIIERTVNSPDGNTRLTMTTKVTGKGQVALANKILASGVGLRLVV